MAYAGGGHICQCLSRILTLRRNATTTVSGDRRRTGREFVEGVAGLARGLVELGVKRGDVVAIVALNSEWYLEWLLAVSFVGGIVAPLNYRWSLEEAEYAMEHVKPVMLVVDESCRKWAVSLKASHVRLRALIGQSPYIFSRSGHDNGHIKRQAVELLSFNFSWAPRGIALICFTSGTTGRPKGVAISHTALIVQALAKIAIVGYCEDDVYLHTAPLCHIGGISSCIANLMACTCHVFISKFNAQGAIRVIEQNQVTSFITVPTMMADMVKCLGEKFRWKGRDSVRKILNGGGNLSADLINSAINVFPHARLISAYGMTEACSSLTFTTLHDPASSDSMMTLRDRTNITKDPHRHHLGGTCVGKPPVHIELQIEGTESNDGFPTSGRILTRGSHMMVGYWDHDGDPSSIVPVDWFDTGDLGWIDCSGFLWLLGRSSSRIKSGGENVYSEEVEAVLSQHPGVSRVVVLGIPDYRLGEMVTACVFLKENWKWTDGRDVGSPGLKQLSKNVLQEHCRQRNLTGFKIPKSYIPWRRPLPHTTTGKLKREEVRKEVLSHLQSIPSSL